MRKQNTITIIASALLMAGCAHHEREQASYNESINAPAYGSSDTSSGGSSATVKESSSTAGTAGSAASDSGKNPSDARTITPGTVQSGETSQIYSNSTSQAEGAATSPGGTAIESSKVQGNDSEQKQQAVQSDTSAAEQSTSRPTGDTLSVNIQGSTSADQPVAQRIIEKVRADSSLSGVLPLVRINVEDGKATLKGTVKTEEQKEQIEKSVEEVSGVTSVDNQLKVSATQNDATNP